MSSEHNLCMDEALLKEPANQLALKNKDGRCPSLLTVVGVVFLTFNSIMAVYRSNGDMGAISFVVFSYLDLVVLFYFLRQFERTPPESPRREHIKMVVWLLTTMLTAAFSYKVAEIMPLPVQVLVWAISSATVLVGFYAFFLYQEGTSKA
ncbi:hypothetical protein SEVIR_1G036284v4 [Setaria viridis]|uniref:Uncharacterized protein n=1 Tax=Setaria viridis TaxID=4556 RepID=A0A4U6W655_SETVI|nr:hypothetical protein SEVIR_1G036284v2 [Setaria viridis]